MNYSIKKKKKKKKRCSTVKLKLGTSIETCEALTSKKMPPIQQLEQVMSSVSQPIRLKP